MKFCRDCAHIERSVYLPTPRCGAQQAVQYCDTDIVSGYVAKPYCVELRGRETACGEEANWFVAKPPPHVWWPFRRA